MKSSTRSKGFTLVELIVVMGVLAMLLTLILPSLMQVRMGARASKCANNINKLYDSLANYGLNGSTNAAMPDVKYGDFATNNVLLADGSSCGGINGLGLVLKCKYIDNVGLLYCPGAEEIGGGDVRKRCMEYVRYLDPNFGVMTIDYAIGWWKTDQPGKTAYPSAFNQYPMTMDQFNGSIWAGDAKGKFSGYQTIFHSDQLWMIGRWNKSIATVKNWQDMLDQKATENYPYNDQPSDGWWPYFDQYCRN